MTACTVFLAASLALAGATTSAAEAEERPAHDGPRVLVLVDGSRVETAGPVSRRNGLLVYRTRAGVLASLPEDRVTSLEDARPKPGPGVGAAPEKGVAPPLSFTDEDLPEALLPVAVVVAADVEAPPAPGTVASAPPPWTYDGYVDRDGRDAAWWQARVSDLAAERAEARSDLERWTKSYRELSDLVELECSDRRGAVARRRSRCIDYLRSQGAAQREAAEAEARLAAIDAARRDLDDEARRAGALPGWLR